MDGMEHQVNNDRKRKENESALFHWQGGEDNQGRTIHGEAKNAYPSCVPFEYESFGLVKTCV
jgi:hypothetical protein